MITKRKLCSLPNGTVFELDGQNLAIRNINPDPGAMWVECRDPAGHGYYPSIRYVCEKGNLIKESTDDTA